MKKIAIGLLALACAFSTQAAERIVVAGGSITELIYAIGAGNRVVGVDETTSYPPQTQALPHIGYWKQLSSEGILSLRPDSFITWQDAGPQLVFDQLRAQKVNVVTLPRVPATVEQMYANIHALAKNLNAEPQGDALVNTLRQRLDAVAQSSASKPAPIKAMFILSAGGSAPQVAGKGSVADANYDAGWGTECCPAPAVSQLQRGSPHCRGSRGDHRHLANGRWRYQPPQHDSRDHPHRRMEKSTHRHARSSPDPGNGATRRRCR